MKRRLIDAAQALRVRPDAAGWLATGRELTWAVPLLLVIGYVGNLVSVSEPPGAKTLLMLAATAFVVPALGEELLFRAAVIPRDRPRGGWMVLSVVLFVLWHPLQVVTFGPPWASAFLDAWFLAAVAVLGTALARIYVATGSIWPCVAVHWIVVVSWKAFLGGPF